MKEKVDITGMTWQEVVALVNCSKTTAKNALKHGYYVVNFKKRTCFTCADNLGCNLEPRCESMDGCIKWRCRVCRAPWWTVGYDHEACNARGVPNGVTYHDGTYMAPLPETSGHYFLPGGYCSVHKSWRCGLLR